jgi:hypothetical protein
MLIITEERLVEYARKHPESSSALFRCAALVKVAAWKNLLKFGEFSVMQIRSERASFST